MKDPKRENDKSPVEPVRNTFLTEKKSLVLQVSSVALVLILTAPLAFAAPPKPRLRVGAPAAASSREKNSAQPRETQDGADSNLVALARDAQNWFEPETSEKLREFVLSAARERRQTWRKFPEVDLERAAEFKIRRIPYGRIVFYTDLPSSKEVDQIPEALDAAVPLLCKIFHADPKPFEDWKIEAFLMRNVDAYVTVGALEGSPRFLYGYSDRDRIFAKDQGVGYYNRFLLTHELVHTFMNEYFGDLNPRWYSEGAAEYLALHNWSPKKGMELEQFPVSATAYPGFGRLRQIKRILATGRAPTLLEIMSFEPRDYEEVSTYAWSWAFVAFLSRSPKYREIAEVLPYWMVANDPNALLIDAIGDRWGELEYDWADFLENLDYDYDFEATSIDSEPLLDNPPTEAELRKGVVVSIEPTRGWRETGVAIDEGKKYKLTIAGRFKFYVESAKRTFDFEGTGATVEYVAGRPTGRVRAVVAPKPSGETFADVYQSGAEDASSQDGADFRFKAFRNARRTRFGDAREGDASGFSDDVLAEFKEREQQSKRDADAARYEFYNALYPWNAGVEFATSSVVVEPDRSGVLYLRVNAAPKNLKRNEGRVKVQIKLLD